VAAQIAIAVGKTLWAFKEIEALKNKLAKKRSTSRPDIRSEFNLKKS